jgi:phage tail-like protein
MSQAISALPIVVQMFSMSVPQTLDVAPTALSGAAIAQIDPNALLLHPGEPGEILVSLENPSDRTIQVRIEVDGTYPPGVCLACLEAIEPLAAKKKQESTLRFKVQDDFFERQDRLSQERPRLQLNYQIQIYVYEDQRLLGYGVFSLFVRPRSFYQNFLPAVYREIDFVERFVSIFEQTFDPYVQAIDTLWAYLDPLTAPESLLPFLAHWVAWRSEPNWPIEQQRQLIRKAIQLYQWHGTRRGLRLYLHLYTGLPLSEEHINIEEIFEGGLTFGRCHLGQDSMIGGGQPYHFIVRLRSEYPDQLIDEPLVRTVIDREKPPFCTYDLSIETSDSLPS